MLRRPHPSRSATIGVWEGVLRSILYLSVLTNAALVAFTSEQLASWMPWLFRDATAADVQAGIVQAATDAISGDAVK